MIRLKRAAIQAAIISTAISSAVWAADAAPTLHATDACTKSEKWEFTQAIPKDRQDELKLYLTGKATPVRGFSEGLALRSQVLTDEAKALGEYWLSRALFDAKLHHIAYNGFARIAAQPSNASVQGVRIAALECMNAIRHKFPSLRIPEEVATQAAGMISSKSPAVSQFFAEYLQQQLTDGKPVAEIRTTVSQLKGGGVYETYGKALLAVTEHSNSGATRELEKLISNNSDLPESLKAESDSLKLLLARSYYSTEKFDQAISELKSVKKSSNYLTQSLIELAWAHLMDGKYGEAIGDAVSLQAGGLRRTFSPEAQMVMAMALNELCQYPDSIRAINQFKTLYEKPYFWLDHWVKTSESSRPQLYALAKDFLKKKAQVPDKVASEWLRSPVFLASQDEINLLFDENDSAQKISKAGAQEQKLLGLEIRKFGKEMIGRIRIFKSKMKPGEELPDSIKKDLLELKRMVAHYRHIRDAAPIWKTVIASHKMRAPTVHKMLASRIESDLRERTVKMHAMIEEIAENNQLIEVEIFNGASQDIIWQNAHPDYKEIAKSIQDDHEKAVASKTWDWGRMLASSGEDGGEIWEDELGSFKADTFDNCSSKDKYLALKRRGAGGG